MIRVVERSHKCFKEVEATLLIILTHSSYCFSREDKLTITKAFCLKQFFCVWSEQDGKERAGDGLKAAMLALLWESPDVASAARSLAHHLVRQIFERHP